MHNKRLHWTESRASVLWACFELFRSLFLSIKSCALSPLPVNRHVHGSDLVKHLVNSAQKNEPQFVTKHGKEAVVVLAFKDYKKLSKPKTDLYEFFQKSPLAKPELEIERNKD